MYICGIFPLLVEIWCWLLHIYSNLVVIILIRFICPLLESINCQFFRYLYSITLPVIDIYHIFPSYTCYHICLLVIDDGSVPYLEFFLVFMMILYWLCIHGSLYSYFSSFLPLLCIRCFGGWVLFFTSGIMRWCFINNQCWYLLYWYEFWCFMSFGKGVWVLQSWIWFSFHFQIK